MTEPAQRTQHPDRPTPAIAFTRRNVWMSVLMVVLLLLLTVGQWLAIQAGQDVAAALGGTTRVGPVDIQYKGMSFSSGHVLVAHYEISGIAEVKTARWHAKPWGLVELAP